MAKNNKETPARKLRRKTEFVDKFMRETGATDRQASGEFARRERAKEAGPKKRREVPVFSLADPRIMRGAIRGLAARQSAKAEAKRREAKRTAARKARAKKTTAKKTPAKKTAASKARVAARVAPRVLGAIAGGAIRSLRRRKKK